MQIHGGDILFNSLHEDPDPALLMQDILGVRLPSGHVIDVGWYPQFDPEGRYKITLSNADFSRTFAVIYTRDVREVAEVVGRLAAGSPASDSSDPPIS